MCTVINLLIFHFVLISRSIVILKNKGFANFIDARKNRQLLITLTIHCSTDFTSGQFAPYLFLHLLTYILTHLWIVSQNAHELKKKWTVGKSTRSPCWITLRGRLYSVRAKLQHCYLNVSFYHSCGRFKPSTQCVELPTAHNGAQHLCASFSFTSIAMLNSYL